VRRSRHTECVPRERPIIFSGESVRAIIAGTKNQTRRVARGLSDEQSAIRQRFPNQQGCPYGMPGTRLWAREAWRPVERSTNDGWTAIEYRADGAIGKRYWRNADPARQLAARALDPDRHWRSPLFLPRWASRLLLEVDSIRVERLQEISEEDARAEGVTQTFAERFAEFSAEQCLTSGELASSRPYAASYAVAWDELNDERATWKSDPWVWVLSFHVIQGSDR